MDRINLTIHVENVGPRRVNVRRTLRVHDLINEVRGKFNLLQGSYALRLKDAGEPLEMGRTLEQLGIPDGAEVIFYEQAERVSGTRALIDAGERLPISARNLVSLKEEREGLLFDIEWQPAIIGRADQRNPSANRLLAVNLSGLRGAEYVSRQHACITESNNQYFIESLNPRNPTYLNNEQLEYGEQYVLHPGDRIRVGKITLIFNQRGY